MKIKLTTSGLPVGRNVRVRTVDMDHARDIIEFTNRGYHVAARSDADVWSVHFYSVIDRKNDPKHKVFSNQPDGTTDAMIVHVYKLNDATLDPHPEWVTKLIGLVDSVKPSDMYLTVAAN